MPQPHAPQESDFRHKVNTAVFVASVLQTFPAVFLHRPSTGGKRWPIPAVAVGALLLPLLLFAFLGRGREGLPPHARTQDAEAFLLMWVAWFLALCLHKARASPEELSFYDGTPWLCSARNPGSELAVKRYVEPLLCVLFGWLMAESGLPVFGAWWMACGAAHAFVAALRVHRLNTHARDRIDAELQADYLEDYTERVRHR